MKQRYLGIDHGSKRIGVAGTDALGIAAHGVEMVDGRDVPAALARIGAIAKEREVVRIVAELPINMDGSEGVQSAKARAFGEQLAEATGLPVEFWDERLTSREAEGILRDQGRRSSDCKERGTVDIIAAQLLLSSYLAPPPPTSPTDANSAGALRRPTAHRPRWKRSWCDQERLDPVGKFGCVVIGAVWAFRQFARQRHRLFDRTAKLRVWVRPMHEARRGDDGRHQKRRLPAVMGNHSDTRCEPLEEFVNAPFRGGIPKPAGERQVAKRGESEIGCAILGIA